MSVGNLPLNQPVSGDKQIIDTGSRGTKGAATLPKRGIIKKTFN